LKQDAEYTTEAQFNNAAGQLPVLRLVDEEGRLIKGAELPFSFDEAADMYRTMVRVGVVDQILNSLQRQGRVSFYMTSSGEEAACVGSAAALDGSDVIWPQYRELGAFMQRGFTIQQVVDQCMSRESEAGKGRQMPVHYCAEELNMQAVTSPLATQIPQAVGAGYAFRTGGERRCGVSYFGDGAASEGDFAVALNFAATLRAQTIFLCRNNGWAISTPASEQYAGDGIAVRGIAYGMRSIRVDGNDLAAVYMATRQAREACVEHGEPVLIEMMTYRRGHHSTSDDATRYRPGQQLQDMSRQGLEPMSRTRLMLTDAGKWSEAEEEALREETRAEVMEAMRVSEAKPFAAVSDMFADVWAKPPESLKRQQEELSAHLRRHPEHFKERLAKYAGSC
jgi:2-oxoisovalerate dehydrogenase E1 component alpha subunit